MTDPFALLGLPLSPSLDPGQVEQILVHALPLLRQPFIARLEQSDPLGLAMRRHIILDIVTREMGGPLRYVVDIAATLIMTTFAVWFMVLSYDFAAFSKLLDARSDVGAMLLWPWMALLPACTAVIVLISIAQVFDNLRLLAGKPSLFLVSSMEELS